MVLPETLMLAQVLLTVPRDQPVVRPILLRVWPANGKLAVAVMVKRGAVVLTVSDPTGGAGDAGDSRRVEKP